MANVKQGCPFCKDNLFPYHRILGLNLSEAIIYSDKNVFVTPDLSPLGDLHFLIIPHEHFCNYAVVSQDVRESLYKAISFIRKEIYKSDDFILFEHGSTKMNYGGNSIDHAHVHIIRGKYDIIPTVLDDAIYDKFIDNISLDQYAINWSQFAYFWVMQGEKDSKFFIANNPPSQYLRQVFIRLYPTKYGYDWKKNYQDEQSIQKYLEHVSFARKAILK